jgi:hypothetical protein
VGLEQLCRKEVEEIAVVATLLWPRPRTED